MQGGLMEGGVDLGRRRVREREERCWNWESEKKKRFLGVFF